MVTIKDKRNDHNFWIDLSSEPGMIVYKKLLNDDYVCLYNNIMPSMEGIIYEIKDIKSICQPIKDYKYYTTYHESINFDIVDGKFLIDEGFDIQKYINKQFNYNRTHTNFWLYIKNNEIVKYTDYSYSIFEIEEEINLLKYFFEKDCCRNINIEDFKLEIELN